MDAGSKASVGYVGPNGTTDYTASTGDQVQQAPPGAGNMKGGMGPGSVAGTAGLGGMSVAGSVATATHTHVGMPLQQPRPPPAPAFYRICGCIECYSPGREVLEYDYTYDDTNGSKPPQGYPRIRERGEYYIDSFNGEPWSCTFGTTERVRFINSSPEACLIIFHLQCSFASLSARLTLFSLLSPPLVSIFSYSNCHAISNNGEEWCLVQ